MRKYAIPFFLILTALAIIAVFAYNFFEIYEKPIYKRPVLAARTNEYLAMEQWLSKTGHPVRVITSVKKASPVQIKVNAAEYGVRIKDASAILAAPEKIAVVMASYFDWQPDTFSKLLHWIAAGGNLIICLDIENEEEEAVASLVEVIATLGVEINYHDFEINENSSINKDAFPSFSHSISFTNNPSAVFYKDDKRELITDASGRIKLVRIPMGNGSITLCGDPVFMESENLKKEKNALLSWHLTGEQDAEKKGALFIRGVKTEQGFFGKLAERGNFPPLLVSALILAAIGFWMVIPVFGRLAGDAERPGKPMRERFLAEARFLKKYKGMGSYLEIYYLYLKQRFSQQYGEIIDDESSFFSRLAEICKISKEDIAETFYSCINSATCKKEISHLSYYISHLNPGARRGANTSHSLTNREFIKHIYTIEKIMERL